MARRGGKGGPRGGGYWASWAPGPYTSPTHLPAPTPPAGHPDTGPTKTCSLCCTQPAPPARPRPCGDPHLQAPRGRAAPKPAPQLCSRVSQRERTGGASRSQLLLPAGLCTCDLPRRAGLAQRRPSVPPPQGAQGRAFSGGVSSSSCPARSWDAAPNSQTWHHAPLPPRAPHPSAPALPGQRPRES